MGMSASQARFLSLTARKNNVEFHGQQINQQRTTLSNESANYYSELTNLAVPIPPSIDDYTKISYSFEDGAVNNTIISIYSDKNNKSKYIVNYLQSWNDDYAIVPATSSMVETDNPLNPTKFSIGNQVLRKAGSAPSDGSNDEYYNSLSASQRASLLKNETYLLKMAQEKTGDNGNFYVRYVKNTSTGQYEPYLYAESELKQANKYNNKNLAAVPCFSLGTTTKTQEVLNKSAYIEKDPSGRFVAITFDDGIALKTVPHDNLDEINRYYEENPRPDKNDYTKTEIVYIPKNNQSEIDEYWANNPAPVQGDYTKDLIHKRNNQEEIDNYFLTHPEPTQEEFTKEVEYKIPKNNQEEIDEYKATHTEPTEEEFMTTYHDTRLCTVFNEAADACYSTAIDPSRSDSSRSSCYIHVLAHMLDLDLVDATKYPNTSAYPKNFQTSVPGYGISINSWEISESAINGHGKTPTMQEISDALKYGYEPEGVEGKAVLMAGDIILDADSSESDKLLGDYYIKDGGGTSKQKLMSNYYYDSNTGEVLKKTLRQKAIDLFYLCENKDGLGASMSDDLVPAINAFRDDMQVFTIFKEEEYNKSIDEWTENTTFREWEETETKTVDDVEAYTIAYEDWLNGAPEYREWEETETVSDVDGFQTAYENWLNGAPEYREWQEEQENIVLDKDAYSQALDDFQDNVPEFRTWETEEESPLGTRTYKLKVSTATDEDAYNSAMNQYAYDKAVYDSKIEEINSKIKIIQHQDKNLELKLKQLDTEENAIQTEMDAVKKVISKNVESSFKTFNA